MLLGLGLYEGFIGGFRALPDSSRGFGACGVGDGQVCEMSGPLGVRNCGQR